MRYISSLKLTGFAALMTAALFALVAGCGGDGTTEPPPVNEFAPPTGLTVVNGPNEVFLEWVGSTDAADSDFKGYNVYRNASTMVGATDAQLITYKLNGTNVITSTSYHDGTALNGSKYYYAVRALRGSSELSTPTSEYDTAPRREGAVDVELGEYKHTSMPSGVGCATAQAYAMKSTNPDNRLFIDCYLGTMSTTDEANNQALALKSPDRVKDGDADWESRIARLKSLGTGQPAWDTPNAPADGDGWASQVELAADPAGMVIAVRTPADASGKRHYAKMMITSMSGVPGQRVITATVAYQEIADYPRFVAGR